MSMKLRLAVGLFTGIVSLFGQTLPKGVTAVTAVEGITEYKLENGLRVLLFPDPSKNTVTVNVTYLVGSRNESYGETGMAHLLEHLVFKGTPTHPNIPKELTDHGASPNGSTYYDRTNYFETFAATDENLKWALDLEADRMVNSYIARKDLDSEYTVVRNEFERGENSPFLALYKKLLSSAYDWHNYGKPVIGSRADIENVKIENLQAFYRKYYQPDNAVLMVAGKIDPAQTLTLVNNYFGKIPRPKRTIDPTYTAEPVQDGERFVTVRRVGDVKLAMAAYHIPAAAHPDLAALEVLSTILGDTPGGRLYKALVETKKATTVSMDAESLREPGFALAVVNMRKDQDADAVNAEMLQVIEGVMAQPVTEAEVERAKQALLSQIDLALNDSARVGLTLSEPIASGDWRLLFIDRDRIKKVTAADAQRVALTYFKKSNRTAGLFLPEEKPDRAEIPATPDIDALVKNYKGSQTISQGEAFDVAPLAIEKRTERGTLPNGMKWALIEKKTRGGKVTLSLTARVGDPASMVGMDAVASLAASLLDKGTAKHTRQQLSDEFDRLKARVRVGGQSQTVNVSVETVKESLPEVMTLVAEVLQQPVFSDNEFEEAKRGRLQALEANKREPTAVAVNALQRHMNPYPKTDARYVPTIEEEIANVNAVTVAQVKSFYSKFYGGSAAEVALVGDFDSAAVKTKLSGLFGGWKSPSKFVRIEKPFVAIQPVNESFETPDKANALFLASSPVRLKDADDDYPALLLGNFILGGGFLNSRLATRIRQKEGLSYGVGSAFQASSLDDNSVFLGNAILAPQNIDKVEKAFTEEMVKAFTTGFSDEEVNAAKKGWLQSRQVQRGNDTALTGLLSSNLYLDRTMAFTQQVEAKVDSLTAAQVNAVFKKYMDPANLSIFKAGDFAGAKAKAAAGAAPAEGAPKQ